MQKMNEKIVVKPDTNIESFKDKMIKLLKEGKSTDEILKTFDVQSTECEIYSRVVGFFTPVKRWNAGKQEEYEDRVEFDPKIFPKEGKDNASANERANQSKS